MAEHILTCSKNGDIFRALSVIVSGTQWLFMLDETAIDVVQVQTVQLQETGETEHVLRGEGINQSVIVVNERERREEGFIQKEVTTFTFTKCSVLVNNKKKLSLLTWKVKLANIVYA